MVARIKYAVTKNNAIQPITAGLTEPLVRDGLERGAPPGLGDCTPAFLG